MAHYNVIVAQGGGAKIPYEMGVLARLEEKIKRPVQDYINMVVGTSTGSVVGSLICSGKRTIAAWSDIVLDELPSVFKKRGGLFPLPRYNSLNYKACYERYVGKGILMRDLPIRFMCTSIDRCQPRTHFMKSWEKEDGALSVIEAVTRSFSAPYYFGSIIDVPDKKIWIDGGMGYNNLPLLKGYIEILLQGWLKDGNTAHILSVGSGRPNNSVPFEKAREHGILSQTVDQLKKYMGITDGGLTREMSAREQIGNMKAIVKATPNLTFQSVDWVNIPKYLDKMDNIRDSYVYHDKGLEDGKAIDEKLFKVGE